MLSGDERDRELALAEALALSGGRRCAAKLVEADRRIDIGGTGYVSSGIELLASGAGLEDVCRQLAALDVASEGFAIEVRRIPGRLKIGRRETANALALVIRGRPDLDRPSERFLVFATADGFWMGRTLEAGKPEWRRFARKLHDFSSALPSQVARAVCNLVVRAGERVVDPCCGSGTLLLNAADLGASVTGFDINKKMVGATNANLLYCGFPAAAELGDATEITGRYDVALANLPYGHMSAVFPEKLEQMVVNIVRLAPRGALITIGDISPGIRESGAEVRQVLRLRKQSMTRLIFIYERAGGA